MSAIMTSARADQYTGTLPPEDWAPAGLPPAPVPVLAPYLGLVCSVSSALIGGWLLLAPYAFDYRAGATKLPRTAIVDLTAGAATVAISTLAAVLFGRAVARRLHPAADPEPEPDPEPDQEPEPGPPPEPSADPDGGLRDLLGPLVAALAADLRNRQDAER
jgi:hypothetical protein